MALAAQMTKANGEPWGRDGGEGGQVLLSDNSYHIPVLLRRKSSCLSEWSYYYNYYGGGSPGGHPGPLGGMGWLGLDPPRNPASRYRVNSPYIIKIVLVWHS